MELTCWEADTGRISLSEIINWCLVNHSVNRMLVVLRLNQDGNRWRYANPEAGEFVQNSFGPHIITGFQAAEWPGTKSREPAFIYVLNFNEEVKEAVLQTQPSLAKWQHGEQPTLPEDICLFRESDAHPIFLSSTHHYLAWLLSNRVPVLEGFKKTDFASSSFFPQGRYFCRKFQKRKTGR